MIEQCGQTDHKVIDIFLQYLSSNAGANEGAPATGASTAAHGVPDSLLIVTGSQNPMQRCLERTWQT